MLDFYKRSLIEEMWGKEGTWGRSIKNKIEKIMRILMRKT